MNQVMESQGTKETHDSESILYSQIIEYSVEAIIDVDQDNKILYINQSGADFLRGKKENLIGVDIVNFFQEEMKERVRRRIRQGMSNKEPFQIIEKTITRLDGTLVDVELYCHPVQFGSRKAFQFVLRDLTARKETEKLLNDRQKLASIGQIAAGIAHEVKNPLTSVKGFLQLLKENSAHPYLYTMEDELEKAIETLQNLLQVSRPNLYEEPIVQMDVCKELNSIMFLFQDKLYNIEIEVDIRDADKRIYGKRNLYLKAFFNLIKNAIEAMPAKGKLRIEHYCKDEFINVKISDSGVGIPREKINLLGTPFFSSKSDGTGLGLTQVYTTIDDHGGQITVNSEVGQGTTFHLKLPIKPTGF